MHSSDLMYSAVTQSQLFSSAALMHAYNALQFVNYRHKQSNILGL